MQEDVKAESGIVAGKQPTAIDYKAASGVFDLPEDDPDLFSPEAKDRIKADREEPGEPTAPLTEQQSRAAASEAQTQQWEREGIPPIVDTQRMMAPARIGRAAPSSLSIPPARVGCPHCEGRGFVPGINDHLRDSVKLLFSGGSEANDKVIRDFYVALFREAPDLSALFPGNPTQGDLGTDHRGAKQRELLLGALASLAELYDPSSAHRMETLDAALKRFGRAHAAFTRPDGTVRGATLEEYKAVKDALFTTLVRAAGDQWRAEFGVAWSQAYDYAAAAMLVEQHRSGFTAARYVRG